MGCWIRSPEHRLRSPWTLLWKEERRRLLRIRLRTRSWRCCPPRCRHLLHPQVSQGLHGLVGHYYGKRSADADAYYGYYGHGVGIYNNNVYSGFHGNHYANGLPGRSFAAVTRGKRSAEAEAEADPYYGYGYGRAYGYGHGYGYGHHGGYYGHG